MQYFVVIEQDNETAKLKCESYDEACLVKQSFINYGKCSSVVIETIKEQ